MIRLALAFCLAASPGWATVDGWPALYDVAGVASDDVLNVRSEPGAAGDVIGALAPDATDVEVIRPNGDESWGLVNTGEGTGWVSLAFLARQPGQWAGSRPAVRQCFGTEPFWSLDYAEPAILLSMPDRADRAGLISGLFRSASRIDRFVYSGSFFPTETGEQNVVLALRTEACSDGMSDRVYGIGVEMFLAGSGDPTENGLWSGCCSLAPPGR